MQRQRGDLVLIGEALGDLDGLVKAIHDTSPQALHHFTLSDQVNQLIKASEADPDLGFMVRLLALCSLPSTNPGNRREYIRCNSVVWQPEKGANMKIRIQSREIDVPKNNPFENDLLKRKESIKVLTRLIDNLEGPCVLAVDAAWGTGKTTFLRIWAEHLRNQGFPVVEFNAWETDFSGDPFVALSAELTENLEEYTDKQLAKKIAEAKKGAKEVLRRAVPGAIRLASAGILDVSPLLEKEVGQALASYAEDRLSEYQEAQKAVRKFRSTLQDMARELSAQKKGRPLIVMIDELDRCRPSYAVELLEVAKHLFSVDHIVFVLAVNRFELAHSIKGIYGGGFDAKGYLRRFFDVDFQLPEPDPGAFIDALLDTIQLNDYFERTQDPFKQDAGIVRELLQDFFRASDISLRLIAQAIHRLGLVFSSLGSDQRSFANGAVAALIFRTLDADLYHRICSGTVSDREVVDELFKPPRAIILTGEFGRSSFEKIIILAAHEMSGVGSEINSPLLEQYKKMVDAAAPDSMLHDPDLTRAQDIVKWAKRYRTMPSNVRHIGFRESVRRIELLSPDLIDERSGAASQDS